MYTHRTAASERNSPRLVRRGSITRTRHADVRTLVGPSPCPFLPPGSPETKSRLHPSCSMQGSPHVVNGSRSPLPKKKGGQRDIPRFLQRVKDNLSRPTDEPAFGLMDSKYAKRFEELWQQAEPALRRWASGTNAEDRYTVLRRSSTFWVEGFPRDSFLGVIVRVCHPVHCCPSCSAALTLVAHGIKESGEGPAPLFTFLRTPLARRVIRPKLSYVCLTSHAPLVPHCCHGQSSV